MWQARLPLTEAGRRAATNGSPANVSPLVTGAAEVAVSQLDVAADRLAGKSSLRALAAIYNDALQIVVPAGSAIRAVADLRGSRVAIGTENSGVAYVALRVLAAAGLAGENDVRRARLDLAGSVAALRAGEIDAFFWVGALPTRTVDELAAAVPVRLLDLEPVLGALRGRYPVYTPGTVLAGTYRIEDPVSPCRAQRAAGRRDAGRRPGRGDDRGGVRRAAAVGRRHAGGAHRRRPLGLLTQPVALHDGALRWFSKDAMG